MKKLLVILTIFASGLFAQSKVGTTAANFLTIPVGPRATGMGGAYIAVASDITAAFWNPSGLSTLAQNEFHVNHTEWLVGTRLDWLGAVIKMGDSDAFAISLYQLDYGEEEITTITQQNGTGEKWSASDLAFNLSYSRNLTDRFSIGATFKYITQKIWNESASAFALDVGLLFQTELEGLKLGMNISNFGTEMKLDGKDLLQAVDVDPSNSGNNENIAANLSTDSWTLPLMFSVGVAYDVFTDPASDWKVTLASDALIPNNQTSYINVGGEFGFSDILFIRGGYNSLFKEDAEEGLTAGIGLQYSLGGLMVRADYSYMDFGRFDEISRYALTIGF